jgi:DNA-binding NtrC family response regulator
MSAKTSRLRPAGGNGFHQSHADELASALKSLADAQKRIAGLTSLPVLDVAQGIDLSDEVHRFEKRLIETALACTHGSQVRAAHLLKITPSTLNHKISKYHIGKLGALRRINTLHKK